MTSTFRSLHDAPGAFVIPNPWDIGTARYLASLGFPALATTSAGYAFSRGLPDGAVSFDEMIAHCRELVAAVDIPVSADLEHGMGDSPDDAAATIAAAAAAGLAGCSIEDATGDPANPIYPFDKAVERVAAAVEATRGLKHDFVFTARAENFLWGRNDLDDTIRRLQAYEAAGADVLYAPALTTLDQVRTVCSSVSRPVNVLAMPQFSVDALVEAGVRRISLGSKLTTVAFGAMHAAARQILDEGSFALASASPVPFAALQKLFGPKAG